jgi:hypothetical protein
MPLTNEQIAAAFKFSKERARALIREGMPLTSIEEATAWREARALRARQGRISKPSEVRVDPSAVVADESFEQTVERHRELKEAARQRYIVARDAGLAEESKLYTTYQNILKTLVVVEREALARKIESKELIKTSLALDRFQRVLAGIKADILGLGLEVAPIANPDSPGTALKVIDEKVQKLLEKWSTAAREAGNIVAGETTPQVEAPELDAFDDEEVDEDV